MRNLLNWWYLLSLPPRPPALRPLEREQERYARLTAALLFLMIVLFLPLAPIMLFFSPASPSSPPIGATMLVLLAIAWISGRLGSQKSSAGCLLAFVFLGPTGPLLTNPFSASLVPLFGIFAIAVILAGAMLPPAGVLITGVLSCLDICLVNAVSMGQRSYTQGGLHNFLAINSLSLSFMLPLTIQIIVTVVVYALISNLLSAIRRADRAEEVIALQRTLAEYERMRIMENKQLREDLEKIVEAHVRIANGDYQARVTLNEGNTLWSIAAPLNTLLNRLQYWKKDSDTLQATRLAAEHVAAHLRRLSMSEQQQPLPLTNTPLDVVITEFNKWQATQISRTPRP